MDISSCLLSQDLASLLITVTVQAILISLLGFTAIHLLSKRSAPVRSLVCAGTIAALGLVLVISIGFRSFDIAWTQPTLPVLLEENRADSVLFSELERLSPVETITPTNPSQSQISIEKDMIHSESATSSHYNQLAVLLIPIVNFMGFVWVMGFLFQLLRLVYGVILVKKFRDSLPSVPDASFNEMVRNVAGAFWKNRMPELYSSPKIESPITIGVLNPIVIIPAKLLETLSENELKSILLHELAHIYHYDQVIGVIKRIILAVHWWNPLVHIINREHERAREEVSDDYVLRELHPKVYTQCLADLAEKVCLITNFPTAVGMAGKCFSLPTRVECILSKKRGGSMGTRIYIKTITFAVCLVLTFGVAGVHGKVKSVKPGDAVIEKQEDGSFIHPVSFFEEEQRVLEEKVTGFEMIEKQDQHDSRVISNAKTTLQTEPSDKQVFKSVSLAIVMAHAKTQTAKNPEKQTESDPVQSVDEPVLSNDAEDTVVRAQNESAGKVPSDAATVSETRFIEPKNEDAATYISRGVSCLNKGQIEDAISEFDKAIDLDPGKAVAYIVRGSAYYELDQLDNAISDYNKAIEIAPGFAVAYRNRGSAHYRQSRFDNAISDYNKAIELNPEDAVAYHNRGTAYSKIAKARFDHNKAISDYNKAIEINPGFAAAYNSRGSAYSNKGRHWKAISNFSKAIELNPEDAVAYQYRGSAYYAKGRFRYAISDFSRAIELNPEDAVAYNSRGTVYRKQRRFDNAISDFNKAIEIAPAYTDAYINRGGLYHFIREYEKAVSDYGKAIELNPEDDITKERQEYAIALKQWPPIGTYHVYAEKQAEPPWMPNQDNAPYGYDMGYAQSSPPPSPPPGRLPGE